MTARLGEAPAEAVVPAPLIATLAVDLGKARDLQGVYRHLREFVGALVPMCGMFVSRYEPVARLRTCEYGYAEGDELDVSTLPPMPNTGSPHSRALELGQTIITGDFQEEMAGKPRYNVGLDKDPRLPQSSVVVVLRAHDEILGGLEVQSTEPNAFKADHVATIELAAHLAALAVENVKTIEDQRRLAAQAQDRAAMLDRRMKERVSELASKNRELEAFSFTAAHDLRAPLRAILSLSEDIVALEAGRLSERGLKNAKSIQESSRKMGTLVDDLLQFARSTQGSLRREMVDMTALAREILADFESRDPGRKTDLVVQPNLFVSADPVLVRTLLTNLLANAWKYSAKTPSTTIHVGARLDANEIVYTIEDHGVGFDPRDAQRMFLAFERLAPTEYEGTGLGLATAERIVTRHGGQIWAEGRPGKGATLYFTLASKTPPS